MPLPAYSAAAIRAAERPLLEAGRGEALMRTAAAGLASVCREVLRNGLPAGDGRGRGGRPAPAGGVAGARVAVLAGPGNNGGDALFAAADLASRGAQVRVLAPLGRLHAQATAAAVRAGVRFEASPSAGAEAYPDARAEAHRDAAAEVRPDALRVLLEADLVIDGLLGTGARLPLREPLAGLLGRWQDQRDQEGRRKQESRREHAQREQRARRQLVVAVDMPTGVDATTGECDPRHVRADVTVTFGGAKAGQFLPGGAEACGRVDVVDIGLDLPAAEDPEAWVLEDADLRDWPLPGPRDHKYTRGVLGVIAGSARYPGAGVLTSRAALAAGVGMVRVLGARAVQDAVLASAPECVTAPGRVQAWAMGPGAPEPQDYREFLMEAVGAGTPLVLDAGALEIVPALVRAAHGAPPLPPGSVLTPHAGELARLLSALPAEDGVAGSPVDAEAAGPTRAQVEARPAQWAREAARRVGAVVLLKGGRTLIAQPSGVLWAPSPGPALLATAGSGDVLAGLVGAALATGSPAAPGADGPAAPGAERPPGCADGSPAARGSATPSATATPSGASAPAAGDPHARAAHLAALAVLLHNRAGRRATHASAQIREVEGVMVGLAGEASAAGMSAGGATP
jgi:hydroxyethylthiazole kinase-like uncharacterized protein yjeF